MSQSMREMKAEMETDSVFDTSVYKRPEQDLSKNNGGRTDYYSLPTQARECQDIIEWRDMNFSQGNIMKIAFTFNTSRHSGTDYERDLNKIIYFAQRELKRISNAD